MSLSISPVYARLQTHTGKPVQADWSTSPLSQQPSKTSLLHFGGILARLCKTIFRLEPKATNTLTAKMLGDFFRTGQLQTGDGRKLWLLRDAEGQLGLVLFDQDEYWYFSEQKGVVCRTPFEKRKFEVLKLAGNKEQIEQRRKYDNTMILEGNPHQQTFQKLSVHVQPGSHLFDFNKALFLVLNALDYAPKWKADGIHFHPRGLAIVEPHKSYYHSGWTDVGHIVPDRLNPER